MPPSLKPAVTVVVFSGHAEPRRDTFASRERVPLTVNVRSGARP